ncbi:MAG: hypothetical protein HGA86_03740, partial [Anaerolineaceae bacterium]|nr:hypothetical protein [Anaerolineaceae bacterium]
VGPQSAWWIHELSAWLQSWLSVEAGLWGLFFSALVSATVLPGSSEVVMTALLTAFYTMRQITLVFLGKPRTESAKHAHETSGVMTWPLVVLAFFAITAGWVGIPDHFPLLGGLVPNWFEEFVGSMLTKNQHLVAAESSIPLLTSLVVSLGGLLLGWLAYRSQKAGQMDPLEKPLGAAYPLLKNKYYIDEIYQKLVIRPSKWLSETFVSAWVDKGLLDGILHGIGKAGLWLGIFLRKAVDQPLVSGGGDALADGTRGAGRGLSTLQHGRVQQYMVIAVSVLVLAGIVFIIFLGQV